VPQGLRRKNDNLAPQITAYWKRRRFVLQHVPHKRRSDLIDEVKWLVLDHRLYDDGFEAATTP